MGEIDKVQGVVPAFTPVQAPHQAGDGRQRREHHERKPEGDVVEITNEAEEPEIHPDPRDESPPPAGLDLAI